MADIDQKIYLSTLGADESAAAVRKTGDALNSVTSASSGMEAQFSHRFQHIGLMLFAGDALHASGLGRETRQIINGLNTALIAGESAFGAAAGPAFLFVAALTAVAGIAAKVISHHKELAESLDKVVDTQQKAYMETLGNVDILTRYNDVMGGAGGLLESEKALAALQQGELLESQRKQVQAIQDLMQSNIDHAHTMAVLDGILAILKNDFEAFGLWLAEHYAALRQLIATYDFLKHGIVGIIDTLKSAGSETQLNSQRAQELADKNAALKVKLDQLLLSIKLGGQAWKDYAKNANDAFAQVEADMAKTQQADDAMNAKIDADTKKTLDEMNKKWQEHQEHVSNTVGNRIGSDFGHAMNQMVFEEKTATQAMNDLWKTMAQQFIVYVSQMIAKAIALRVVMSGLFGGFGAMPAMMAGGGGGIAEGSFATGGTMVANRPTLALFGESGPEIATFTPMGQAGGGSGGGGVGTVNISLNVDHIEGNDPAGTLDMLSQEIRRQTVAGRTFANTVAGVASKYPNQAY